MYNSLFLLKTPLSAQKYQSSGAYYALFILTEIFSDPIKLSFFATPQQAFFKGLVKKPDMTWYQNRGRL